MTSSLDALKAQLNIIDDADDAFLTDLISDTEAAVTDDIGATEPVSFDTAAGPLRRAILMRAAHMYANREAVIVGSVTAILPLGYYELIAPYRNWDGAL
jgi:hypothetical protein